MDASKPTCGGNHTPPFRGRLRVLEYSLCSRSDARRMFRKVPELQRAWGSLYVVDSSGERFTVFGDPEWVRAQFRLQRPMAPPEDHDPGAGWNGMGVDQNDPAAQEWPLSAFNPDWIARGWPDDWPHLAALEVWQWRGA